MQPIPEELLRTISKRLKLGERAKPVFRVEVDRLAFIPGRLEHLSFITLEEKVEKEIIRTWIDPVSGGGTSGDYQAESVSIPIPITFPVIGYTLANVSSEFGMRWGRLHSGIDISVPIGTPVVAAWSGRVTKVNHNRSLDSGLYVEIQHSNGFRTRYLHLNEIRVSYGQSVDAGQIIGLSGNTGNSTGPHLHFEIIVGSNNGYGGTPVDPKPYLTGAKSRYATTTNVGVGVVDDGLIRGVPGEVILHEKFDWREWYKNSKYQLDSGLLDYSFVTAKQDEPGKFRFRFPRNRGSVVTGFVVNVRMNEEGWLDVGFNSNFSGELGDALNIYVNGKIHRRVVNFKGLGKYEEILDTYIPKGNVSIRIEIVAGGQHDAEIVLDYIKVQELNPVPDYLASKTLRRLDPTLDTSGFREQVIEKILFGEKQEDVYLQVGQFVYMDTLVLDNVISIDIDNQFDLAASQANVTISNPGGWYSPDYNPYYFPEIGKPSPWSYYINGFQVGVLSENTPIRIYAGYGLNLIRIFTGLIDKVDISGESQLTITCRDMYKRVLEKVLTETKQYPEIAFEDVSVGGSAGSSASGLSYRDQIIVAAKTQAAKFPGVDYKFLLAIAQHETKMGTQGMGTPDKGGFVLGYGCYSAGYCDPTYKGVERQMYYGAKRVAEALRSRGAKVTSKNDVYYFHDGGDLGTSYMWSSDREAWVNSVWSVYQQILANPSAWDVSGDVGSTIPGYTEAGSKPPWVKSAVVQDLVKEAGLYGWRVTAEDRLYPDAVIEETYLIEVNQKTGKVIRAVPDKPGEFEMVDITSVRTPQGWLNPFVEEYGKTFEAYKYKVADAIAEVMKDTGYRYYCDRYGTFRLERIRMDSPVVDTFTEYENLISIKKTVDWSRGRSHLVIIDGDGKIENFIDKEILLELKGEVRTAVVEVPWARSFEQKKRVADNLFFDMKRNCRTLQVAIPMNPALDILDRVYVVSPTTTTRAIYTIKGIRTSFSDSGAIQVLDLMWAMEGVTV